MPKFRILFLLAAAVAVSACAHQSPAPAPPAAAPAAASSSAVAPSPDPNAAHMPDGPGKTVTVNTCTGCHTLARVVARHQTRAQWQQTLSAMQGNGLDATPAELKAILDYLAQNYGPVAH